MMQSRVNRITILGVLCAIAILLGYIESFIVIPIKVPGIKLGLSNIVTVFALFILGPLEAFIVLAIRIILAGFLFGSGISILYSACGGLFSILVMILFKRVKLFSVIGISVIGAVFHNIGQVMAAMFIIKMHQILYYLPVLIIAGCICGMIIGFLSSVLIRRLSVFINGYNKGE